MIKAFMQILDELKQRTNDDWLIGYDSRQFNSSVEQLGTYSVRSLS